MQLSARNAAITLGGDDTDPVAVEASSGPEAYELTVVVPTYNERGNVLRLLAALRAALEGVTWHAIFVDDDSPDGTADLVKRIASADPRVQCLRRVGRRGLAGAVVEGAMASAAPFVAVIDGDLQHDETLLPRMLATLKSGHADLAIATRYVAGGSAAAGFNPVRSLISRAANAMARRVLRTEVSDPVSGFFMVRRELVEEVAPRLSRDGYKILFDILASSRTPPRITEFPYEFRERASGDSKLDGRVVLDYAGLVLAKATRDVVSPRAVLFGLVGGSGLMVHLGVLKLALSLGVGFTPAQALAAATAMTSNYLINNAVTYRDRRKRGLALLTGYVRFALLCGVGLTANVAVASLLNQYAPVWWFAGAAGAAFGALWNYVTTSIAVW